MGKSNPLKFFLFFLALFVLIGGCARNIKKEPPPEPVKVEPEVEIVKQPPPPPSLDFKSIPLKITSIFPLDKTFNPYNSYSPKFSPDERYIAFEANRITYNTILIYKLKYNTMGEDILIEPEKIGEVKLGDQKTSESIEELIERESVESFNYEFSWFPNSTTYIFTSNAGVGIYNLFLGSILKRDPIIQKLKSIFPGNQDFGEYVMLTEGLKKDGQARVSPDGTKIVFTSGRTGNGDLYLLDINTGNFRRLTDTEDTDLYPRWSPDGKSVVFTRGGKYSQDIYIIRDVGDVNEREEVLVKWFFDDVLPSFSPDGKYISFYTTYNLERDPFNTKRWGLMIIPSDGTAPKAGKELTKYFCVPNVVKDNSQGVAWFPDGEHIILAKNIDSDYNPIYIYSIKDRQIRFVKTSTNINHDLTVSSHGLVSFRAQSFGWDRIFIARTTFFDAYIRLVYKEYVESSQREIKN